MDFPLHRSRRVALYSHDTMGLGHARRNLLIAQALATGASPPTILLIAGVREVTAFPLPPGTDQLTLPALGKSADGRYHARSLGLSLAEIVSLRQRTIAAALEAFEPDVLIVDNVPRGAVRELDPALAQLRRSGRTRCVLGLRDVLDELVGRLRCALPMCPAIEVALQGRTCAANDRPTGVAAITGLLPRGGA